LAQPLMRCFWDERQRAHAPAQEFFNGALHPAAEHAGRVEAVLAAINPTEAPADHGAAPLLRVHSAEYLHFLQSAFADWREAGREGDAFPYSFPVVGRRPLDLHRIDAKLGQYSYDTATPIGPDTWEAVYWGAQTALGALGAARHEGKAFAFCRPPGHHAGRDYCGGYSYINNAAVAAEQALADGCRRVAILDVDYHHGNGTQDIFAGRTDVLFASLHADPRTDYPFFWGHADENRANILNLPLPRRTGFAAYDAALARALEWIGEGAPELLIVSFGADTYVGDPISHFALEISDYTRTAGRIAALGLPTLIVMEGGYAVDALGTNVAAFISGL
jgi:acetoin utilization deacetylase AcuC-like enzyme